MNSLILNLLIPVVLLTTGCGVLRPGIPGSGVNLSEVRQVAPFEEVNLSGFGTVNVQAGQAPSICVSTDDNLISHIETSVINGRLLIRPDGPIRPRTGLQVNVTVPGLTAARVSGAGEMNVLDVAGEQLDLSVSGAGTLTANGLVNHVSTSVSGAGDADLRHLYAVHAKVRISGAGDARVCATESLDVRVSGAGDVVCFGNPKHVDQHISGAGDLVLQPSGEGPPYSIGDTLATPATATR